MAEGQASGFSCSLVNYAEAGATLSLQGLIGIPDRFSLYVEPDSVRHACRVVEKRGNTLRVSFESREENIRYRSALRRG